MDGWRNLLGHESPVGRTAGGTMSRAAMAAMLIQRGSHVHGAADRVY